MPLARRCLPALMLLAWGTANAQAPTTASRYLPLDDVAYEVIGRLRDRGYLGQLNPLVQPYRRMDVARGLASLDPDTLRQPVAGWVRLLKRELAPELDRIANRGGRNFGFLTAAGARASSSRRLDPARPLGTGSAWPWYRAGAWVETGPIAAETRVYGDFYFRDDPDGTDPGFDPRAKFGGQTDNGYLSVSFPQGSVDLGLLKRNWGVIGTPGMAVSDLATPYSQVGVELHAGRVTLRAFAAQLDTVIGQRRHLIAHRLDYQHGNFAAALGETKLYVYPSLLLSFLNPLDAFVLSTTDDPVQNVNLFGQVWWRRGGVVLYADGFLDDIWIFPGNDTPLPPRYAFTGGARLQSVAPWVELRAEYQQVGAWTYRTPRGTDNLMYMGRGLGANYSDYDRLTIKADLFPPVPGLRLTPAFTLLRQGEGSFRDAIPGGYFAGQPALFLGVIERTIRLSLGGRYQPVPFAWLGWDLGPNFVGNQAHVAGIDATHLEATGEIGVRLDFPRDRLP